MVLAEVSHDVLAAIIGAIALVMVPVIGFLIVNHRAARQVQANLEQINLVALRERIDEVMGGVQEALRIFSQAHERRSAENEQLRERLEDIAEMLSAIRNGKGNG